MTRPEVTGRSGDHLVPDPQVADEFNVSLMTLWRWTRDEKLGFPEAIKIRNRNFRSRNALEAFKEKLLRDAIRARPGGEAA